MIERPALYTALRAGDLALARTLLAWGADPNEPEPAQGRTPLHAAIETFTARDDRYRATRMLLDHGADPARRDASGGGPLALALLHGDRRVVELLVQHGGDRGVGSALAGVSALRATDPACGCPTHTDILPERRSPAIAGDAGAWIRFLRRLSAVQAKARPALLRLVWRHNARG